MVQKTSNNKKSMWRVGIKILIVVFMLSFVSCEEQDRKNLAESYLPLEIGNYWKLENTEKREILNKTFISDKEYYIVKYMKDTFYYRIEDNKVFVKNMNSENIIFDFNAKEKSSWNFDYITVSLINKKDTIVINHKQYTNCYHFLFDIPEMADDEFSIWLAPDIGFIQEECEECELQIKKLQTARLNNIIYYY